MRIKNKRISVDRRPNRNNKVVFSNLSGIVCTGPNRPNVQLMEDFTSNDNYAQQIEIDINVPFRLVPYCCCAHFHL